MGELYEISQTEREWVFKHRFVLSDIDHGPLTEEVRKQLGKYEVHTIDYKGKVMRRQLESMARDLKQSKDIVSCRYLSEEEKTTLEMVSLKGSH